MLIAGKDDEPGVLHVIKKFGGFAPSIFLYTNSRVVSPHYFRDGFYLSRGKAAM